MKTTLLCIGVLVCAAVAVAPTWAGKGKKPSGGPSYTIQKLDDLDGIYANAIARDINGQREIIGQVDDPVAGTVAAYWAPNGAVHILPDGLAAAGINELGEIVGAGFDANGDTVGRYWSSHADATPLALLPLVGDEESAAYGINRNGVICGYSRHRLYGPDPQVSESPPIIVLKTESRAVIWRILDGAVQGPFELPNLLDIDPTADPDNAYGTATAINDNDGDAVATVVGGFMSSYEITANDPGALSLNWTDAVAWSISFDINGDLVAFPSVLDADASAQGVNNNDLVCGDGWAPDQATEAVVWTGNSSQTLDRSRFIHAAWANDVNDNGVIVGRGDYSRRSEQGPRAVVWTNASSSTIVLEKFLSRNSPFAHLSYANAVNQAGEIVGGGWDGESSRAFLAIPE